MGGAADHGPLCSPPPEISPGFFHFLQCYGGVDGQHSETDGQNYSVTNTTGAGNVL